MVSHPKDVTLTDDMPSELLKQKHIDYIVAFSEKKDDFEYTMTQHIRMSGIYWGVTALQLSGALDLAKRGEVLAFVGACLTEGGGFSPSPGHDPHLLSTLSAVQVLATLDALDTLDLAPTAAWVAGLQREDGAFQGDCWGERDTRFSFCAAACLALLGRLDAMDRSACVAHVMRCHNADGGFGTRPGAETHAGQVFCCLGTLALLGEVSRVDADALGWWLCERQLPSGGLNGRPEKLPDVCYSWWVLSCLTVLNRLHWIDAKSMKRFILATQDAETGGFTDRPGDVADPYHTLFGLAGLSLLGEEGLASVNPVLCMDQRVVARLGVTTQLLPDTV